MIFFVVIQPSFAERCRLKVKLLSDEYQSRWREKLLDIGQQRFTQPSKRIFSQSELISDLRPYFDLGLSPPEPGPQACSDTSVTLTETKDEAQRGQNSAWKTRVSSNTSQALKQK